MLSGGGRPTHKIGFRVEVKVQTKSVSASTLLAYDPMVFRRK